MGLCYNDLNGDLHSVKCSDVTLCTTATPLNCTSEPEQPSWMYLSAFAHPSIPCQLSSSFPSAPVLPMISEYLGEKETRGSLGTKRAAVFPPGWNMPSGFLTTGHSDFGPQGLPLAFASRTQAAALWPWLASEGFRQLAGSQVWWGCPC